jgi:hypothetical protein
MHISISIPERGRPLNRSSRTESWQIERGNIPAGLRTISRIKYANFWTTMLLAKEIWGRKFGITGSE